MTMQITYAEILQSFFTLAFGDCRKTIRENEIINLAKDWADYDWGLDTSSMIIRDTDSHPV